MATKIDKIKERKAALLAKLKDLEKEEINEVSEEKKVRRKEDTRTKMLIGILVTMSIKEAASEIMIEAILRHADKLTPTDRKFLAISNLWKEIGLPVPQQDAAKTPPPVTENRSSALADVQPATLPPPASPEKRVAAVQTMLTKARYQDREEVKALGALYNIDSKMWFLPAGHDLTPFEKWL